MTWRMRGRLTGSALLLAGFVAANLGGPAGIAAARTGMIPEPEVAGLHAGLSVAQMQARAHLNQFFDAVVGEDGVARKGAALRIALMGDNGRIEEVWVTPFARRDGYLIGVLSDEPQRIAARRSGDLVNFQSDDVRDWSFFGEDGRMYGNYTTRLMLSAVAPAQAAEIAALLSETPAPADW